MTVGEILNKQISWYPNALSSTGYNIAFGDYFSNIVSQQYNPYIQKYRDTVEVLGKDSDFAKQLKVSSLVCVTPSGIFSERKDSGLRGDFTGIIVLDLDAKDNYGIDIDKAILDARNIPNTLAYHKSVSGEGYAIYVYVDKWQRNTYSFAMSYYTVMLGVTFDRATSNLSRLRFISYDEDLWLADRIECLEIPPLVVSKRHTPKPSNRQTTSNDMIGELVNTVISNGDDPTQDYADWFTLGCAIANGYGESGRTMFHIVSSNYYGYDYQEVDAKFDSILSMGEWKANKGSIVFILSKYQ